MATNVPRAFPTESWDAGKGTMQQWVTKISLPMCSSVSSWFEDGSRGFLALLLFVVGSLIIGVVLGGCDPAVRSDLRLGTAQRTVAAVILIATINFGGTMTLPFTLVASIVLPLILLPTARVLGKGSMAAKPATSPDASLPA